MNEIQNSIRLLKAGDQKTITAVYKENRAGFILFCSRYPIDGDEVADVYQDAVIALCENAKKGKLDTLSSSISTYLYAIGKYMIFQRLRKKKTYTTVINDEDGASETEFEYEIYDEIEDRAVSQLREAFAKLGDKCKKVLSLFYYEEKKLDEIQDMLGYSNKDVLKSQKSRCIKQLRDLTQNK